MNKTLQTENKSSALQLHVGSATKPSYQPEIDAALGSILANDSDRVFKEKLDAIDRAKAKTGLKIVKRA